MVVRIALLLKEKIYMTVLYKVNILNNVILISLITQDLCLFGSIL